MKQFFRILALSFAGGLTFGGCDDFGSEDETDVSVSFAVRSFTSGSVIGDPVTVNGHTLDLQTADVTFTRIKLDRRDSEQGGVDDLDSDSEADSDEEEEIRIGATTVSLPLAGGVITPITAPIPAGVYESFEADVASIRLRGTYDGQPFDVTLPLNASVEQNFSPPFEVTTDADRPNVTVLIDTSLWLRRNDGSLIDPRLLATDAALRAQVSSRIHASFRAFEDSDRDADDTDSDSDSDSD